VSKEWYPGGTSAGRERVVILKPQVQSLIGIAEDFVLRVHNVEDRHVCPQSIARQHGIKLCNG
jgi:hypothetical protein